MKKIFLVLFLAIVAITSKAQYLYRSYEFAYAERSYNRWVWTDWIKNTTDITVGNNRVYINSNSPQYYVIIGDQRTYRDSDGAQNMSWSVIDQDYDTGTLRIRQQKNNVIQLYIEFSNVKWVYSSIKQIY